MKSRACPLPLLMICLAVSLSANEHEHDWQNLSQLHPGEKIEVVKMDLKTIKGDFVTFTTDSLSLSVKGDPVTLKQGDVYRVMSRERSHRGRNALIGAAIGAGILAPLSYVGCQIGGDNPSAGCTAAGTSIGAGIGAGLGSLNAGYQTIYRAKHRTEKLGRVALAEKVPHSVEPLRLKSPSAPSAGVIPYRLR